MLVEWEAIRATMRKRRIDRGLSQAQVAEMMGRSQDYVSYLENNTRSTPTVATATLWTAALGGTLTVVFQDGEAA